MSKASNRVYDEWRSSGEVNEVTSLEYAFAKIRARRDEIGRTRPSLRFGDHIQGEAWIEFWNLFDDGEEFGPDKPEPPKTLIRRLACADGFLVKVQINGRAETISEEAANELKKLGAEEARATFDEDALAQHDEETRREFAREAIGYFRAKRHEHGNQDATLMLLGYLNEQAGE